jgi:glycosyltransferase involved in cell wall biosynthesis
MIHPNKLFKYILRFIGLSTKQSNIEIEQLYSRPDPWGYQSNPDDSSRKEKLIGFYKTHIPNSKEARLLDVGCGEGWITQDYPAEEIVGVDISKRAIARANNFTQKGSYYSWDINKEPLDTLGKFDVIVVTGVLYKDYLNENAVEHIISALKPGGCLLASHIDEWERWSIPLQQKKSTTFPYRRYHQRTVLYRKPNPMVTIGLPIKGDAPLLEKTIISINEQSYQNIEVIVVDDGASQSAHETLEKVVGAPHIRWRLITHPKNLGIAAARNTIVKNSTGRLITFLSADDQLSPKKIEKQVEKFITSTHLPLGAVSTMARFMTPSGQVAKHPRWNPSGNLVTKILSKNLLVSPMFDKRCYEHIGLYREDLEFGEDWELHIRLADKYVADFVKEPLITINTHRDQISAKADRRATGIAKIIEHHKLKYTKHRTAHSEALRFLGVSFVLAGSQVRGMKTLGKSWLIYPPNIKALAQLILALLSVLKIVRHKYHQNTAGVDQNIKIKTT